MNKADYDRALHYTYRSEWDNLLILMVRTKDHFLSKKIEKFLHAYYFHPGSKLVKEQLLALIQYIDHASQQAIAWQERMIHSV